MHCRDTYWYADFESFHAIISEKRDLYEKVHYSDEYNKNEHKVLIDLNRNDALPWELFYTYVNDYPYIKEGVGEPRDSRFTEEGNFTNLISELAF